MKIFNDSFTLIIFLCCITFQASAQVTGLGFTDFENSGSAEAQDAFSRGILLLHSFEYEDSREAFIEARTIDPEFAMAYWGEAMTHNHPIWMRQETDPGRAALMRLAPDLEGRLSKASTNREKDYLRAVEMLYFGGEDKNMRDSAYHQQLKLLSESYPDDLDAATFYALSFLGLAHDGRDFTLYMQAAAIAEEVFAKNPRHPGAAHYLIHAYDDPVHAPLGLRAARVYAKIAPDASHALHMPSHIFTALGMWTEMASANEEAYAASVRWMERKGLKTHTGAFHARHWRAYAYQQLGRYTEAEKLLEDMISDVRENESETYPMGYVTMMLSNYFADTNRWDSQFATIEFETDDLSSIILANIYFIRGKVALSDGNEEDARYFLSELMKLEDKQNIGVLLQHQLKAELLKFEGNLDEAIQLLEQAAKIDSARPLDYGPPEPGKPTHELLGEFYLLANKGTEAIEAFQASLARAPGRSISYVGLLKAAQMVSDEQLYHQTMSKLKENWKDADPNVTEMSLSASAR